MNIKNIFKISIVFIILIISVGSIYASQDADLDNSNNLNYEVNAEFDESLNDDIDVEFIDNEFDEDLDEDIDVDFSDEDLNDDVFSDDGLLTILDDDGDVDDNLDDEFLDLDDSELEDISDFDFLKFKINSYLQRYGNLIDENWINSDEFINMYQVYLNNSSNYDLKESVRGYETYLKIFNSITSTFDDYNLTDNETQYLKFMIIYFLNNYGNVSENYTWNESDNFSTYFPFAYLTSCFESANGSASDEVNSYASNNILFYNPTIDDNLTSVDNTTNVEISNNGFEMNIIALFLMLLFMLLIII